MSKSKTRPNYSPEVRERAVRMVLEQIEFMCDYVNDRWAEASAVHLCAYVLWRLNWIHPFGDGNGRTARAIA
jgi:Fic family protein